MEAYGTMAGVSFRGSPDTVDERARALMGAPPESMKGATQESPTMKPRNFFLIIGTFLIALVVLTPFNDAVRSLEDPTIVFFVGRVWPERVMMLCAFSVLLYIVAVVSFFGCARQDDKNDVSLFMIVSIVVTILGLSMVSISGPMKKDTENAIGDLYFNCRSGASTQGLYEYATVLQALRSKPGCRNLPSVTECDGYQESMPYTRILQGMEHQYKCAGFCFNNATMALASGTIAEAPVARTRLAAVPNRSINLRDQLQKRGLPPLDDDQPQQKEGSLISALQRFVATHKLSEEAHAALLQVGEEQVASVVADDEPGRTTIYPPALFTAALYQTSCEGMAARDLQYQSLEVACTLFWQGTGLLFSVVLGGFLKIFALCRRSPGRTGELSRKLGVLYT